MIKEAVHFVYQSYTIIYFMSLNKNRIPDCGKFLKSTWEKWCRTQAKEIEHKCNWSPWRKSKEANWTNSKHLIQDHFPEVKQYVNLHIEKTRTSLVAQWLSLRAPHAGGPGLIPGQGARSCMRQEDPACHN